MTGSVFLVLEKVKVAEKSWKSIGKEQDDQAWQHSPAISTIRRRRQEDGDLSGNLNDIMIQGLGRGREGSKEKHSSIKSIKKNDEKKWSKATTLGYIERFYLKRLKPTRMTTKAWSSHRFMVLDIFVIASKLWEMEIFLVLKHSLHL